MSAPGKLPATDREYAGHRSAVTGLPRHVLPPLGGDPCAVGPYRVLGRIAATAASVVLLSRAVGGTWVAVRLPRPPTGPDEVDELDQLRTRFAAAVDRARAAAGPHSCAILAVGVTGAGDGADDPGPAVPAGFPYLVTEYVDGPTLAREVAERGPLAPGELHSLAVRLLDALRRARAAGVGPEALGRLGPGDLVLSITGPRLVDLGITAALRPARPAAEPPATASALPATRPTDPTVAGSDLPAARPTDPAVAAWARIVTIAATGRLPSGHPPAARPGAGATGSGPTLDAVPAGRVRDALRLAATLAADAAGTTTTGRTGAARGGSGEPDGDSAAGLARLARIHAVLGDGPGTSGIRRSRRRRDQAEGRPAVPVATAGAGRRRERHWHPVAAGLVTAVAAVTVVAAAGPSSGPAAVNAGAVTAVGAHAPAGTAAGGDTRPGGDKSTERPGRLGGPRTAGTPAPGSPLPPGTDPAIDVTAPEVVAAGPASPLAVEPRPATVEIVPVEPVEAAEPAEPPPAAPAAPPPAAAEAPRPVDPPPPPVPVPPVPAPASAEPAPAAAPTSEVPRAEHTRPEPVPAPEEEQATPKPARTTGLTPVQIGVVPLAPR